MRIVFAGTPEFAVPCLQALIDANYSLVGVFTQPDRPIGRGRKLGASPVKELALRHNLPLFQPETLRTAHDTLAELKPDFIVVVAYGLILPKNILSIPRMACINIHASLLPRWRGAAPIQYSILNGDAETGITSMKMAAGLDTGDMLLKKICPITPTDTAKTLTEKLAHLGAEVLLETLQNYAQIIPVPQNEKFVTYAPKINKTEAEINWQFTATQIARMVRAFNPWPVAYAQFNQQTVRIWEVEVVDENHVFDKAGAVYKINNDGVLITTQQGLIKILKLQISGGKMLSFAEFHRGQPDFFNHEN